MSFKSAALFIGCAIGSYVIAGIAYAWGRHDGHKDVVRRVEKIRENAKILDVDLDEYLEDNLTNKAGDFVMTQQEADDAELKAIGLSVGAMAVMAVGACAAMSDQVDIDARIFGEKYDALENRFKNFWDGTAHNYCDAYNKTNSVIDITEKVMKTMPEDSDELVGLEAYRDGMVDVRKELDNTIGAFLQKSGAIHEKVDGEWNK